MVRSFYGLRRGLAAGSAAAALLLHPVRAQQAPPPVRFIVRAWPDAAVFGATTTAEVLRRVLDDRLPRVTCAPCDPSRLWGIDRGAVGTFRAGPSNASDVLRGGATWGAGALLALSRGRGEGAARLEDILVFAEALTVTDAATTWTKVLFHRPRPERYAAGGPLPPDRDYAFPSGHTSQAFAAAAAYASILHPVGLRGGTAWRSPRCSRPRRRPERCAWRRTSTSPPTCLAGPCSGRPSVGPSRRCIG